MSTDQRVERRLAAILAADVVGYSRMMGEDEVGTARAVVEYRKASLPIISQYSGRLFKTMGDGILLEFSSVVDAVNCAVALQDLAARFNADAPDEKRIIYRMGVHLGDVLVEGDDIIGDGVNIAARLEATADAGGICLSDDAYRQVRDKVTLEFVELGEKQLKNIARPVRVFEIGGKPGSARKTDTEIGKPTLTSPAQPSIAVLPFKNLSGDPNQEYFADGVVEDIITGLSRIKWLFVIARNSSFLYRGGSTDVRKVGRELCVRYLLGGSVRRAGGRVRITAQLIEADTGKNLWADKYDGPLEEVFELQDRITDQVVGVVEPNIKRSERDRSRRKRPGNLDAYDLVLRSMPHQVLSTLKDVEVAEPLLNEAVQLDPNFAPAHVGLAWCHLRRFQLSFEPVEAEHSLRHASAAVAAGQEDADVLARAAPLFLWLGKDNEGAVGLIDQALALNASSAYAHFFGALVHAYSGHSDIAVSLAERAMRLSPFDRMAWIAFEARAFAAVASEDYSAAARWFSKEMKANPGFSFATMGYAAALALAGRADEAKPLVEQALKFQPTFRARLVLHMGMVAPLAERFLRAAEILGVPV